MQGLDYYTTFFLSPHQGRMPAVSRHAVFSHESTLSSFLTPLSYRGWLPSPRRNPDAVILGGLPCDSSLIIAPSDEPFPLGSPLFRALPAHLLVCHDGPRGFGRHSCQVT